jgi:hypothetical protein
LFQLVSMFLLVVWEIELSAFAILLLCSSSCLKKRESGSNELEFAYSVTTLPF